VLLVVLVLELVELVELVDTVVLVVELVEDVVDVEVVLVGHVVLTAPIVAASALRVPRPPVGSRIQVSIPPCHSAYPPHPTTLAPAGRNEESQSCAKIYEFSLAWSPLPGHSATS